VQAEQLDDGMDDTLVGFAASLNRWFAFDGIRRRRRYGFGCISRSHMSSTSSGQRAFVVPKCDGEGSLGSSLLCVA